ncbi:MAG: NADPH-dependent F420 reductase [Chthonomonadales bacterium]
MNIAIIGAGNVGASLGKRFSAAGHSVKWGVQDPLDPKYAGLDVTHVADSVVNAEVVILAIPYSAVESAIASTGNLAGKILIDVTNPIKADFSALEDLGASSAGLKVAQLAPAAKVVKAFNTVGNNVMDSPQFGDTKATMLVASDHADAKTAVMKLAEEIGFAPIDAGPLEMSRYMEAFAWVWISLAIKQGLGREIAFQLVRR